MRGDLGFHPHAGGGGPPFFLNCSFEYQFNLTSRTLSETVGKWVLLMWRVRTLWEAYYCCIIATETKWDHVPLLWESKKNGLICLHLSSNSSTLFWWLICVFRIDLAKLLRFPLIECQYDHPFWFLNLQIKIEVEDN